VTPRHQSKATLQVNDEDSVVVSSLNISTSHTPMGLKKVRLAATIHGQLEGSWLLIHHDPFDLKLTIEHDDGTVHELTGRFVVRAYSPIGPHEPLVHFFDLDSVGPVAIGVIDYGPPSHPNCRSAQIPEEAPAKPRWRSADLESLMKRK